MTEPDLVRTILRLNGFRPPDGVEFLFVISPTPNYHRVVVVFRVGSQVEHVPIESPPDNQDLMRLYRTATNFLKATQAGRATAPVWAKALGLDLPMFGNDG